MDVRPALVPGARSRIQERSAYRGKPSSRQSLGRPSSEAARGSVLQWMRSAITGRIDKVVWTGAEPKQIAATIDWRT